MEKIRELKSKSDYFQEYFIKVMTTKYSLQNSEKNGRFEGGGICRKISTDHLLKGGGIHRGGGYSQ